MTDDRLPESWCGGNPTPTLNLAFQGFSASAFEILARLRAEPHVARYRKEKEAIQTLVMAPFRQYRDDLVVNWVLPAGLPFETERNVFSRILKNDFGAGGCHDHVWLSFYRHGLTRLTDVQLVHSLRPEGMWVGVYVGRGMGERYRHFRSRLREEGEGFRGLLNPLLQEKYRLDLHCGGGRSARRHTLTEPLTKLPEDLYSADGYWIKRVFSREDLVQWQGGLIGEVLRVVRDLWPAYRWVAGG